MHQETHSHFLGIFARKLERTGVQIARTKVCIARNSRKNKRKQRPTVTKPKPMQLGGSGSSGCLRGVGLIRILLYLDLTAVDAGSWIGSEPTRSDAYIKGNDPVQFIFFLCFSFFFTVFSPSLIFSG